MAEKRVSVKLLEAAKEKYLELQALVRAEQAKGTTSSSNQTLLRSIDSKIAILKSNYKYGQEIPKRQIAAKYIYEYGVTNLWRLELAGRRRLIYTLKVPQYELDGQGPPAVWLDVLDILDHPTYDKIFHYKRH